MTRAALLAPAALLLGLSLPAAAQPQGEACDPGSPGPCVRAGGAPLSTGSAGSDAEMTWNGSTWRAEGAALAADGRVLLRGVSRGAARIDALSFLPLARGGAEDVRAEGVHVRDGGASAGARLLRADRVSPSGVWEGLSAEGLSFRLSGGPLGMRGPSRNAGHAVEVAAASLDRLDEGSPAAARGASALRLNGLSVRSPKLSSGGGTADLWETLLLPADARPAARLVTTLSGLRGPSGGGAGSGGTAELRAEAVIDGGALSVSASQTGTASVADVQVRLTGPRMPAGLDAAPAAWMSWEAGVEALTVRLADRDGDLAAARAGLRGDRAREIAAALPMLAASDLLPRELRAHAQAWAADPRRLLTVRAAREPASGTLRWSSELR